MTKNLSKLLPLTQNFKINKKEYRQIYHNKYNEKTIIKRMFYKIQKKTNPEITPIKKI